MRSIQAAILVLFLGLSSTLAWADNPFLRQDRKKTIASITYFGNTVTKPYVLDRALGLSVGDQVDRVTVSDAWERVAELDIIEYVDIQEKTEGPSDVHLVITVAEEPRFRWVPTFHYERRHDGLILGLDGRFQNVRGRDETVDVRTSWLSVHEYQLRWTNPHILGPTRLGVFVDGYWRRYDFQYEPFDLTDFGGQFGIFRPFGRWVLADARYDHRQLKVDDSQVDGFSGTVHDPAIQLGLAFDSRDLRYYPRRGVLAASQVRFSGLGRDDPYTIYDASLAGFYSLPYVKIVGGRVAWRGSNDTLPLYERTYLGGPANLRGVDFGSVEGDRSFLATLEVRYPLFLLPYLDGKTINAGLHAFHDWGKSWESDASFDDAPLRWSWGLGAHFSFDIYNFRLEWARTDDGDDVFVFEDRMTF